MGRLQFGDNLVAGRSQRDQRIAVVVGIETTTHHPLGLKLFDQASNGRAIKSQVLLQGGVADLTETGHHRQQMDSRLTNNRCWRNACREAAQVSAKC